MTIEDHPQYHRWRQVLEDLIEAQQHHKEAVKLGPAAAASAMQKLQRALTAYHAIAIAIVHD